MNGAESLVHTLLQAGIDTVFANPGTSEMHFVAALDRIAGVRCILCLDETIVTGAADACYRMTGKPAATLLHCGPGLANGVANLHNARRARSAVVNIVGDQATYHRPLDAPLTSDVEGIAAPVSACIRRAESAASVGADAAATIAAARSFPGHVATLILPANTAWEEGGMVAAPHAPGEPNAVAGETIEQAAALLRNGKATMLLLGGQALGEVPMRVAWSIIRHTGAKLLLERSPARLARGRGRVQAERIPYPIDQGHAAFAGVEQLILVNTPPPVSFFAYPGKRGQLQPEGCEVFTLSTPEQDGANALAVLAQILGAPDVPPADPGPRPERPTGHGDAGRRGADPGRGDAGAGDHHRRGDFLRARVLPRHIRRPAA